MGTNDYFPSATVPVTWNYTWNGTSTAPLPIFQPFYPVVQVQQVTVSPGVEDEVAWLRRRVREITDLA